MKAIFGNNKHELKTTIGNNEQHTLKKIVATTQMIDLQLMEVLRYAEEKPKMR